MRQRTDHRLFPDSDGYRRVADPDRHSSNPFYQRYGGNMMMYITRFKFSHPEVRHSDSAGLPLRNRSLIFSRKRLFGYTAGLGDRLYYRTVVYRFWLHHFFTMGAGANVLTPSSASPP